jgi:Aminotransferase class-V
VFALKEQVGTEVIRRREHALARRALASWRANPRIEILGSTQLARLPIVSFGLRHAGRLLHANFVVALLSDLFGIQARSGCSCAGPYGHRLSGIDDELSARMQEAAANGQMGAVLSFTRVSFNYFISEAAFNYVLDAVHLVADHGWKLLPLYRFYPGSGLWRHRLTRGVDSPVGLRDAFDCVASVPTAPESVLVAQLEAARRIIAAAEAEPPDDSFGDEALTEELEAIRWFPLPGEGRTQRTGLTT